MSHVTGVKKLCYTYAWGMSHVFKWVMSLVTRVSESSHTHTLATFYCVWYDSFSIMCVWHDLFRYVTWLMTHGSWLILLSICMTWLIPIRDVTHNSTYIWHASFVRMMWRTYMCDMTQSYVWHDAFIGVAWLIHICRTWFMTHDSFLSHACVGSCINCTHIGWLQLLGSLKL